MAVYAELHDGRRLEFPDGTDPSVIQGTVKKMLAQPAAQPAFDDPGALQAGLISAGRSTDQLVKGAQQAWYSATGNKQGLDRLSAEVADNEATYKPLADAHPLATGIGGTAPALALFPLTGGTSLIKAGISAATPSLLSYGTPEERLKRGAMDGAFGATGAAAGKLLSRVLKPAGTAAPAVSDEVMEAAARIGYKPTPAQITQSPFLGNLENFFAKNPGSSGAMQNVAKGNQTALNTAGARAMGEASSDLGEGTFAAAKLRIGGEFDRLSAVTKPQLGDDFLTALGQIDAANKARGPFLNKGVDGLIDKGLDLAAQGNVTGKAYKEIRTELANQAQTAFRGGDATTGQAYKAVVSALDDAAKSSLSKTDREAWDVARKQWGAYKTMTKGNVAEAGDLSAARVASSMRRGGDGLRTGAAQGDLADVARIGEAFKGVQNPNSGNLVNQLAYQNMFGPLMMAGNKAASSAYLSPLGTRYFSKGLADVGPIGNGLLGRASLQMAIPAGRGLLGVE